jgi:PQ loop repeat
LPLRWACAADALTTVAGLPCGVLHYLYAAHPWHPVFTPEGLTLERSVDIVLIFQFFYYARQRRLYPARYPPLRASSDPTEADALLSNKPHRETTRRRWLQRLSTPILSLVFVVAVGSAAWTLSGDGRDNRRGGEVWDMRAQVAGWTSAFLYRQANFLLSLVNQTLIQSLLPPTVASRIPQIAKNVETKCEGLSMLFFFYALGAALFLAMTMSSLLMTRTPQLATLLMFPYVSARFGLAGAADNVPPSRYSCRPCLSNTSGSTQAG